MASLPWNRLRPLFSLAASLLILVVGWNRIETKLRERPAIHEDDIVTADEVAALPEGTLAVVLPRSLSSSPDAIGYRVLALSMGKSGRPYVLGFAEAITDQEESIQRIAASRVPSASNPGGLSVGMFGVGPEIHRRLRPVPIPVVGGLLGLRGLWVKSDRSGRFASMRSPQDLASTVAVQGVGWSDAAILRRAGIPTHTTEPLHLLELLRQERVDFFPKGLPELEQDGRLIRRNFPELGLQGDLLLAYPFALLFYVHPANAELARAIETGFRRALADGSYEELIRREVFTPWLRRSLRLENRRVISLPNPEDELLLRRLGNTNWLVPWQQIGAGRIRQGDQLCDFTLLAELCGSR